MKGKWESGGKEFVTTCPQCQKQNFAWNPRKQAGHCWTCGWSIKGFRAFENAFGEVTLTAPQQAPKFGSTPPDLRPSWEVDAAREYLEARGVDCSLQEEVGIKATEYRIYCPIWSPFRPSTYYMSRSIIPGQKGWISGVPGGEKSLYWFGKRPARDYIILVEGVFDVLTPGLWGRAMAILGTKLSINLHAQITLYHRITIWLDEDAVLLTRLLARQFSIFNQVNFITVPDDPGSYTPEEAEQILCSA